MFLAILGWFGAIVILAGYALFSLGRLPNGPVYQLSNLVGAVCISLNVAAHGAWPSAFVNGVWAVIAAVVLIRMATTRRAKARATADEAEERRITHLEHAELSSVVSTDSIPAVTAALAVVALAVQHEAAAAAREQEFAPGASAAV